MTASSLRGSSRLIAMTRLSIKGITARSNNYDTLGDADGPQVAVPAFDRVFLGVAVAAEQLHAVQTDLHTLVGAQALGQCGLAGERKALFGAGGAAPGDQPQPVQFDGDVGAHERHGLTAGDRFAE